MILPICQKYILPNILLKISLFGFMFRRSGGIILLYLVFGFGLNAQNVRVVNWASMDSLLSHSQETDLILNFWATWCKPCVAELPLFDSLALAGHENGYRVILVSMDDVEDLDARVMKLVKKKKIEANVWLLDEKKQYKWIDKVHPDWSGSIPATVFIPKGSTKRTVLEHEFHSGKELMTEIEKQFQRNIFTP